MPNDLNKPMPAALEAERIILGSVLLDNDKMRQMAESLEAGDFYSPQHRSVFTAMLR